jgi:very-short-patch-repair endonuclease
MKPSEGEIHVHKPPTLDRLLENARRMRSFAPDAEKRLWRMLRNRRLAGFKFRRQVPMGNYIVDFYCHDAKLAVEADGGQHSEPQNKSLDEKRTAYLGSLGIRVVRFWDNDVLKETDAVLRQVFRELTGKDPYAGESSSTRPHPSPLPEGEGAGGRSRSQGAQE